MTLSNPEESLAALAQIRDAAQQRAFISNARSVPTQALIESLSTKILELLPRDPDLAQVLQVELRQSHKFFSDYRPEKLWQYLNAFKSQVEEAQRQGLVRADVDPFLTMWAIFGALDEISIQWVLARKREKFNLEAAADQVVDLFLHGMMASEPKRRRERT